MKIFHLINSYSRAGAEMLVAQLLADMPQDWERHVCAIGSSLDKKDSEMLHFLDSAGVISHQLYKKASADRLKAIFRLRKIIKKVSPDILHTHCESPDLYGRLASVGLPVRRFRTIHVHNPWSSNPVIGYLLEKTLSPLPVTSIACSPGMEQTFDQLGIPKHYRLTIANGIKLPPLLDATIEKQRWLRYLDLPSDTILVGTVGRVARQKGHDLLIKALPGLLKKHPNLVVVVAGAVNTEPEYYKQVKKMLQVAQLGSILRFVGSLSQIPSFMAACDALVFPSRWEGLSLAVLEALGSGTPTLVSNCQPHSSLLSGPYSRLLFKTESVDDLKRSLSWVLSAEIKEIPDTRALVKKEYSFKRMLQGYLDCYLMKQGNE